MDKNDQVSFSSNSSGRLQIDLQPVLNQKSRNNVNLKRGTTAFDDLPSDRLHLKAEHEMILKELDD
jgi:hypothetical protein